MLEGVAEMVSCFFFREILVVGLFGKGWKRCGAVGEIGKIIWCGRSIVVYMMMGEFEI